MYIFFRQSIKLRTLKGNVLKLVNVSIDVTRNIFTWIPATRYAVSIINVSRTLYKGQVVHMPSSNVLLAGWHVYFMDQKWLGVPIVFCLGSVWVIYFISIADDEKMKLEINGECKSSLYRLIMNGQAFNLYGIRSTFLFCIRWYIGVGEWVVGCMLLSYHWEMSSIAFDSLPLVSFPFLFWLFM